MIDDQTMAAFRMAATLVHALPGLGLEVEGAGASFRVGRDLPESDHQASPCGFRVAVAQAHRLRAAGRPVSMAGLCPADRPTLTLSVGEDTEIRPGGVCVAPEQDGWRVAMATVLPREVCREELRLGDGSPEDAVTLGLHHDEETEVTIVHAHAPHDDPRALALAVRAVESALARCAALELIAAVQSTTSPP